MRFKLRPWRGCNYAQEGDSLFCSATFGNTSLRFCPGCVSYARLTGFERWDRTERVSEQIFFKKRRFVNWQERYTMLMCIRAFN